MSNKTKNTTISVILLPDYDETKNEDLLSRIQNQKLKTVSVEYIYVNSTDSTCMNRFSEQNACFVTNNGLSICQQMNEALEHVTGEYFTIIHAGDSFSASFFQKMTKYGNRVNFEDIDIEETELLDDDDEELDTESIDPVQFPPVPVLCPLHVFSGESSGTTKMDRFSYGNKVTGIDLRSDRAVNLRFPLTIFGVFFITKHVKEYTFSDSISFEDAEKEYILRILLKYRLLLAVNTLDYSYCTPQDIHFPCSSLVYEKDWYLNSLENWLLPFVKENAKPRSKKIPVFLQAVALHLIYARLLANRDNRNRHILDKSEIKQFWNTVQKILFYISDNTIDRVLPHSTPVELSEKIFLDMLKHNAFESSPAIKVVERRLCLGFHKVKPFITSDSTPVNIQCMDFINGKLEIDGFICNVYSNSEVKLFVHSNQDIIEPVSTSVFSLTKYFGQSCFKQDTFHVSVPVLNMPIQNITFELQYRDKWYSLPIVFVSHFSKLTEKLHNSSWRFDQYEATYKNDVYSIQICPRKHFSQFTRELRLQVEMLKTRKKRAVAMVVMRAVYWVCHPFYSNKHIWFFFDKIYKGGDNAEYIYRYACEQNDGIHKYYLIDKNAPDAKKLKHDGFRPVYRNSLQHRMALLHSDLLIVSNSTVMELNHLSEETSSYIRDLVNFDTVCVQHGLSVQNIAAAQNRLRDKTMLYFCASPVEIDNLSKPIYGYEGYDALKLTGVPRFDGLKNNVKKQIILSPTWRMQAAVTVRKNEGVQRDYNPLFKETSYYKVYNDLIQNQELMDAAKQYGYIIKYVLHPIVSAQACDFTPGPEVEIVPAIGNMSYEKLFCESALMITDYSGVQFDFAYMRKPLVYYLPESLPKHYEEGAFKTETMAFGDLCYTESELINTLIEYMKSDCQMKQEYVKRADQFFAYQDHNNCKRVYSELINYQKKHFS